MDVTVITHKAMDFGEGPSTRITFTEAKYHVEKDGEGGRLHVQVNGQDNAGNAASFQRDEWRCVIRGSVVAHPDKAGA